MERKTPKVKLQSKAIPSRAALNAGRHPYEVATLVRFAAKP
jgi:hypothetical protein